MANMTKRTSRFCVVLALYAITNFATRADQVVMQNGDRYNGKVLSVTASNIVLQSDYLGAVNLARSKVANVAMESIAATNSIQKDASTLASNPAKSPARTNVTLDLSTAVRQLGTKSNLVQQVQAQFLAGAGPEANEKFSQMLNDLTTGKMSVADLRTQARSAATQLRALQSEAGEDSGAVDMYLSVLDSFLRESEPPVDAANKKTALPAKP